MTCLLNIDTGNPVAQVSVGLDGEVVAWLENSRENDHAAFLVPAIEKILRQAGISIQQLSAVAMAGGPGSYTGLRVGSSTAKGLCYSLGLPLIAVGSLKVLAHAMTLTAHGQAQIYCPMLDARRQEVYAAIYDEWLQEILPPHALVLEPDSLKGQLASRKILFSGSGADKWQRILGPDSPNAIFFPATITPSSLSILSLKAFQNGSFEDPAYFEPTYLKPFHSPGFK